MTTTCGECHKPFNLDDNEYTDKGSVYWVCPHCDAVLQEAEV